MLSKIDINKQRCVIQIIVLQDFHLNRVILEESSGIENSPAGARPKKKNKKSYDLTAADKFWQKHKGRYAEHFKLTN